MMQPVKHTQPMTLKQQTIHNLHSFGLQHLLSFLREVIGVWDLLLRGFEAYFCVDIESKQGYLI